MPQEKITDNPRRSHKPIRFTEKAKSSFSANSLEAWFADAVTRAWYTSPARAFDILVKTFREEIGRLKGWRPPTCEDSLEVEVNPLPDIIELDLFRFRLFRIHNGDVLLLKPGLMSPSDRFPCLPVTLTVAPVFQVSSGLMQLSETNGC
jgi:hypothetical protein